MNPLDLVKGKYYKRILERTGEYAYYQYVGIAYHSYSVGTVHKFLLLKQICPVEVYCPAHFTTDYDDWANITPIGDPVREEVKSELKVEDLKPGIVYELVNPSYSTHCYFNDGRVRYCVHGKWCKTALSIQSFYDSSHCFKEAEVYPSLPWE